MPAPPAVNDITPAESMLPARSPATPPAVVVTLPNAGKEGATPLVMVVLLGIASPELNDSVKEDDSVERKRDSSRDCSRRNFVDEARLRSE